jgi:uncharacterized membrane protein
MSDSAPQPTVQPFPTMPQVNALTVGDLRQCLLLGLSDFGRAPMFGLSIAAIFVVIGLAVVMSLTAWDIPWLIYPFAIGFPLIGPFAAVGLYEVSREFERGRTPTWRGVFAVIWEQRRREFGWMAFVVLFVFWVWMYQVRLLMALFLGRLSFSSFEGFIAVTFTTTEGLLFLMIGHVVGAALALLLFAITVISMPLLLERDIDVVTAMITSIKAVAASPFVMLGWGVAVTLAVIAGSLPFFLGLLIVLPVLGHTTWHIYRKAVVPAAEGGA